MQIRIPKIKLIKIITPFLPHEKNYPMLVDQQVIMKVNPQVKKQNITKMINELRSIHKSCLPIYQLESKYNYRD